MVNKESIGLIISGLGIIDTLIILDETYNNSGVCETGSIKSILGTPVDCGTILTSEYSTFLSVPLAIWGFLFYLSMFLMFFFHNKDRLFLSHTLLAGSVVGIIASSIFVYLQFVVIKNVCLYCMGSALTSTTLFIFMIITYRQFSTS